MRSIISTVQCGLRLTAVRLTMSSTFKSGYFRKNVVQARDTPFVESVRVPSMSNNLDIESVHMRSSGTSNLKDKHGIECSLHRWHDDRSVLAV